MASSSYDYTKSISEGIKNLPLDKQKEVLDFVEFLVFKEQNKKSSLKRVPELHKGKIWMSEDFNEPLPDSFWLGEE